MELPKNCCECKHNESCGSYRGGSKCRYQREICLQAIRQIEDSHYRIEVSEASEYASVVEDDSNKQTETKA